MRQGIYILADDEVLDYFIALANSLRINWPDHPPVCVIPYSGRFGAIGEEVFRRGYSVMDENLWSKWQDSGLTFNEYPAIRRQLESKGKTTAYRASFFRKLAAFDQEAPFDRFLFLDADIIVNAPLQDIMDALNGHDFVAHDFQWESSGNHVFADPSIIKDVRRTFCAGLFASKKGLLCPSEWEELIELMDKDQEALYAFGPDQSLLNYAALRLGWKTINLGTLSGAPRDSQTYRKFDFRGNLLFDHGRRAYYFHNIGVPSAAVRKVCAGKRTPHFSRYTNYFLNYRFADQPDKKPWRRGVYIVANDRVLDELKALVNSIRFFDQTVEICLIPYDPTHEKALRYVESKGGFAFPDKAILDETLSLAEVAYGKTIHKHLQNKKNRLVNLACWFGPFDEFAYMDADIVVFRAMSDLLSYLDIGVDFLAYDTTWAMNKLRWIFTDEVRGALPEERLSKVFNAGFWMSRKGLFSLDQLRDAIREVGNHPEYCDYASGAVAQPVINWTAVNLIQKIGNLCYLRGFPEPWAGVRKMVEEEGMLKTKDGVPLDFVHWAGKPIEEKFYSRTWQFYRDMSE